MKGDSILPETQQWKLIPVPCYEAKCRNCGWKASAAGTREQAIAWLKTRGWQLRSNGPWCQNCVSEDEMQADLGVSVK